MKRLYQGIGKDEKMVDEKQQFAGRWGESGSSWDDQPFFAHLFQILKSDQKAVDMFLSNLNVLLTSSHRNLQEVFYFCLSQSEKRYTQRIVSFLTQYFDQKKTYFLSFSLEKYLIHQVWHPQILQHATAIGLTPRKIVLYLSLKMRSLDLKIRKQALSSLYSLVSAVLGPATQSSGPIRCYMGDQLKILLPEMIEKEKYGKEVHFSRGIILQILEDEFCEIKKKGIQFLGLCQEYFDIRSLRPLILYMLNDQHQIVRQTSLAVLSTLPDLELQKEDLNALLVCLRQNNIELRSRTYSNITHINATSAQDFLTILEKLFDTLLVYKEDKRKIYTTCAKLGLKYPNYVLNNLQKIYKCINSEEPNWKSLVYKAKVILVACVGQQKWPKTLPKYFRNHYLYIRDMQFYAFEGIGQKYNQKMISGSSVMLNGQKITIPKINISSFWQLSQFFNAYFNIYTGFLKQIFAVLINLTEKLNFKCFQKNIHLIKNQIDKLPIQYNTEKSDKANNTIRQLSILMNKIEANTDFSNQTLQQLELISRQCIEDEEELLSIEQNIFKTRNYDRSKVLISNNKFFIAHSFLQFSCNLGSHTGSQANVKTNTGGIVQAQLWMDGDFKFIRMSEMEFEQKDDRFCYFTIDFKWKRLRCISIYGNPLQILSNDVLVVL